MLKVSDASFSYTDRPLFEHVSFLIPPGQKVGLVGPNGAGKTTLLSLLLGKGGHSGGEIIHTGTIAHVPQEIKYDPVMESSHVVREYIDPKNDYEDYELLKFLKSLELDIVLDGSPQPLSGGQKTKLALARALLSKPNILLLDEPTNFMDIAGKAWVMNFLARYEGTVLIISHDLALMDQAINKILAINPVTKSIDEYTGNYTNYVRLKKEQEDLLKRQILIKEKHIKQMEEGLKKMARFSSDKGVRKRVLQKRRIEKEKAALPEMPRELRKIKVKLPIPANIGEMPLRAINITKSYGDRVILRNVNFTIKRGERVALIGPNGVGKSTFIKILLGLLLPDQGEVIKSDALSVGYYSQEFETFDMSRRVIDLFMELTSSTESFARGFLGAYNFPGDKVFQRVETLSGGEKTRLSIACLTGQNHNLLILDEPTTYLDVLSQRIILESLKEYKGAMIVVSHTPEFITELIPSRAMLFPDERQVFWDDHLVHKVAEV